ncbi:MAG: endonuclease/exonuclease/phosphatase family protein [Gammaproteobacteria bacterium]|nr:endonuclease/exonuclease/phosphatase family protein [Gammaproteobacteria bacterium]MDH3413087.1 endonuclease/exonuclease/phosphatase family protein [Gammaproteobacteria bacterium]
MNADNIRRFFAPWFTLLTLMLATASALSLAGRWHWLADVFAHFVPHYFATGVLLLLGFIWAKRYSWAAVALAVVMWNGWLLSPYMLPHRAPQREGGVLLELLQFNLSSTNPAPLAAIGYILSLEDPPDVVVLFETTPAFALDVTRLNSIYPTIAQMPRSDNFGMAVLSRLEDSEVEFRETGPFAVPSMVLSGRVGAETIRIYAAHPPPPLGARLNDARNAQLRELAAEISRDAGGNVVVAGDLNTTVWSHAFKPLIETARLRDAQRGHGYLPTWAPPPYARWVGVPVDLTLVSENFRVERRHVGPWLASDHWPVHTSLRLR